VLAPLAIAGLMLGQAFDVDVYEAKVVVAEGALALGGALRSGFWPAVQAFPPQDAPDAVAVEVRQNVADKQSEIIEREVGRAP